LVKLTETMNDGSHTFDTLTYLFIEINYQFDITNTFVLSSTFETEQLLRDNRNFDISNFEIKGVKSVEMHCDLFGTTT